MAVTLTATPEPTHTPPRVKLILDAGDPDYRFLSVDLRRDGQPVRSPVPLGGAVAVVYDYDAPFGAASAYTASGEVAVDNGALDWSETWGDLNAWTEDIFPGSWSVAAGVASCPNNLASISRGISAPLTLLTVGEGGVNRQENVYIEFQGASAAKVGHLYWDTASGAMQLAAQDASITTLGDGPATVTLDGSMITAAGDSWTDSLTLPLTAPVWRVACTGSFTATTTTSQVGTVGAYISGASTIAFGTVSDSATLASDLAWLQHPVDPDRSVPVHDRDAGPLDTVYVTAASANQIGRGAQRETFAPLGRPRSVVVTYGDRLAGDWLLQLSCPSLTTRDGLLVLLSDQAPLQLKIPADWGWDIPAGWYSVGDVADDRVLATDARKVRVLSLPLTPVDPPVLVQGAQWSWPDVVETYASWPDVVAAHESWMSLLLGPS